MLVIAAYDVSTDTPKGRRRLQRVAKACKNFGVRVQKSVFEFVVDEAHLVLLRASLLKEIDVEEDSLRIYFLDEASRQKTEHYGVAKPPDLEGALIL